MKLITILVIVFSLLSVPAFSELTEADVNKIRLIIREEVETAVLKSEARTKEYISQEIAKVNTTISEMDKRLTGEIRELDKRLTGEIRSLDKQLNGLFMLGLGFGGFHRCRCIIGVPQMKLYSLHCSEKKFAHTTFIVTTPKAHTSEYPINLHHH